MSNNIYITYNINTGPQLIGGQIYSEGGFANPQTITTNVDVAPNSNSLIIGPDISFSGTVTVGNNSVLTIS
mgnify:CR=1 FL=1